MPLPINLDSLLHGKAVEWERLELKEGWNPLSTLHAICAFANDFHNLGGGYVIIGVEEKDGRPVLPPKGLAEGRLDAIQKEILDLGNCSIRPSYHPVAVPHELDGKAILVVWVPGGQTRPYKARVTLGKKAAGTGPTSSGRGPAPSGQRARKKASSFRSPPRFPSTIASTSGPGWKTFPEA